MTSKLGAGLLAVAIALGGINLTPGIANAHPSGLNGSGCHAGSWSYHCHRSSSNMRRTDDGRPRAPCRGRSTSYSLVNFEDLVL